MKPCLKFLPAVVLLVLFAVQVNAGSYRKHGDAVLNSLTLTPGDTNPALTQRLICSSSFRTGPYRRVEGRTKHAACTEYGLWPAECTGAKVEIDHLIPLELGGSNDLKNLWPESYTKPGAREKDAVENSLHKMVCAGTISLPDAQKCISTDWYACAVKNHINASRVRLREHP